ncbi:MAG: DUF1289 domain-containing protein [Spongiibacteraceae bacterium]|jgi:predicted Fe-S protein YdhL (DUF1289 family)|nr:DUF1289 domain-containing protein [Spongiibacteraceae bacterium]
MAEAEVRSPCVNVCSLNDDDVCVGCWRTAEEIRDWLEFDNDQKRAVLARCHERVRAAGWLFE